MAHVQRFLSSGFSSHAIAYEFHFGEMIFYHVFVSHLVWMPYFEGKHITRFGIKMNFVICGSPHIIIISGSRIVFCWNISDKHRPISHCHNFLFNFSLLSIHNVLPSCSPFGEYRCSWRCLCRFLLICFFYVARLVKTRKHSETIKWKLNSTHDNHLIYHFEHNISLHI